MRTEEDFAELLPTPENLARCAKRFDQLAKVIMQRVTPIVVNPSDLREETIFGLMDRVLGWATSLSRLDRGADYQAQSAGARALLETALDLTLLARGAPDTATRMVAWERSAKLKASKASLALPARPADPKDTEVRKAMTDYVAQWESTVAADRQSYWSGKHPMRWMDGGLSALAREAERLFPEGRFVIEDVEHTAFLNFATHGSTLTLTRDGALNLVMLSVLTMELAMRWSCIAVRMAAEARGGLTVELADLHQHIYLAHFGEELEALARL